MTEIAAGQLRSFVERIEHLHEERATLAKDVSDIFAEAKTAGFDLKALREVLRLRRMEPRARTHMEALLDSYMEALGMRGPVAVEESEPQRPPRQRRPRAA